MSSEDTIGLEAIEDAFTVLDEVNDLDLKFEMEVPPPPIIKTEDLQVYEVDDDEDPDESGNNLNETDENQHEDIERPEENSQSNNITSIDENRDITTSLNEELAQEGSPQTEDNNQTHPYLYLIETFEYQKDQISVTTAGPVKTLSQTRFQLVCMRTQLEKMLLNVRSAKEIGLDLQIAKGQYSGHICYIQVSTRDTDYFIDALKLRCEMLLLTEMLINPKIVKVVARAKNVLANLQDKHHLYVVNIFDLETAKNALGESKHTWSLNTLIKEEYNYDRGQLKKPDHRKRPIPEEYKQYYRAGSHYLIYLYHDYKNKLLSKDADLYKKVLDQCRDLCKVTYTGVKTTQLQELENELKNRHKGELELLKKIFEWRSQLAKRRDLKLDSVLNKGAVIGIARNQPITDLEILSYSKSKFLKDNIEKIKKMVTEVREKYDITDRGVNQERRLAALIANAEKKGPTGAPKRKLNEGQEASKKQKKDDKKIRFKARPQFQPQNLKWSLARRKPVEETSVILNPTNIPSAFTFESNSSRKDFDASIGDPSTFVFEGNPNRNVFESNANRNDFNNMSLGSFGNMQMGGLGNQRTFTNPGQFMNQRSNQGPFVNQGGGDVNNLYRSLTDLKQARDGLSGHFSGPSIHDRHAINQQIKMLERSKQQKRSGGRNDYTRRYGRY